MDGKNISECIRFQSNSNDYIFIYVFINIIGAGWEFQSLLEKEVMDQTQIVQNVAKYVEEKMTGKVVAMIGGTLSEFEIWLSE